MAGKRWVGIRPYTEYAGPRTKRTDYSIHGIVEVWDRVPSEVQEAIATLVHAIAHPATKAQLRTIGVRHLYLELVKDTQYTTQEAVIKEIMKRLDISAPSTVKRHLAAIRASDPFFPLKFVRKKAPQKSD
jgi:hypothetical protein